MRRDTEHSQIDRKNIIFEADSIPLEDQIDSETLRLQRREEALKKARLFHFRGQGEDKLSGEAYIPDLLAPYWFAKNLRYHYPLVLITPASLDDYQPPISLADYLKKLVEEKFPQPDSASILRDNLLRLEKYASSEGPEFGELPEILRSAANSVVKELNLPDQSAETFRNDLETIVKAIPPKTHLLKYGPHALGQLIKSTLKNTLHYKRIALREKINSLLPKVRELLRLDQLKSQNGSRPEALESASSPAEMAQFDFSKLSSVLKNKKTTTTFSPERKQQLLTIIGVLEDFAENIFTYKPVITAFPGAKERWKFPKHWKVEESEKPIERALEIAREYAEKWTELFKAIRIAELELESKYDPSVHDLWFENFTWKNLSDAELQLFPPLLIIERSERILARQMPQFSQLMSSGLPVRLLVFQDPVHNPNAGEGEDPLSGTRVELGYLGIGYREAVVHQTALARPGHFWEGFYRAWTAARPSLHVIADPTYNEFAQSHQQRWLSESAAIESRAHPLFLYNPSAGMSWAEKFSLDENPQPESDWSYNETDDSKGQKVAFTFADLTLLDPHCRHHFSHPPRELDWEILVRTEEFLQLSQDERAKKLPFIRALDPTGKYRTIIYTHTLANATEEKLRFWKNLQELAGIHNRYVQEATEKLRSEYQEKLERQRAELEEKHRLELQQLEREAASRAMQKLATALLELDLSAVSTTSMPSTSPTPTVSAPSSAAEDSPPTKVEEPPAESEKAEEEEDDELQFTDPWIDSALCTSCEECIKINPHLFVYNSNKQAVIGDPDAGTYAELVMAAEKCPARCIHPGLPRNPDEPNLEELIERAKKFN